MEKEKFNQLTAANGRPVADNQNVQTAGLRGPMVVQDPWFLEKLAHFDREVIPERRIAILQSFWLTKQNTTSLSQP